MPIVETFTVATLGVGRLDYSKMIQHAVSPFVTLPLTQAEFTIHAMYQSQATVVFPYGYNAAFALPQEDGTWGWLASTIPVFIYEIQASAKTNNLVMVGLRNYASIADYYAGIIHERFGELFRYGNAKFKVSCGVRTEPGYLYCIRFGCWSEEPTFDINVELTGMAAELTPPWTQYAP
jgi:hypothetical protein